MQSYDCGIQLGGTFSLTGRIKNPETGIYVSFAGATILFRAADENNTPVDALDGSTAGGEITLDQDNTRFTVRIEDTATAVCKFKYATYNVIVIWTDGTKRGILQGKLSPKRLLG